MRSNSVFYLDEHVIKFLQVSGGPKKSVTAVHLIDIEKQNDAQISGQLASLAKTVKLNLRETRVTVLVPRSRAILRQMTVPSEKPDEIRSIIGLQAASSIPYTKEEVEIDFQILSKTPEGYTNVSVVIIPQETALRYWRIFTDARIRVDALTISSTGLWLLHTQGLKAAGKTGAVLDLDADHCEVCLCSQQYWVSSREIPGGLTQIRGEGLDELVRQWEMTTEKFNEGIKEVDVVSSMGAPLELLDKLGSMQEGLVVKETVLTKGLTLAAPSVKWPRPVVEEGMSLAPLAGIALSQEIPPIDLIPRAVKDAQRQREFQRQLVILGVWGSAAFICVALAMSMGFFRKKIELSHLDKELAETRRSAVKIESRLGKINDIKAMMQGRLIFSQLAGELEHLMSSDIYLVNIAINEEHELALEGTSSNSVDINVLQKRMAESKMFANVGLDYVNKRVTQQGEVDYFKITATLN